jgi:hypothetical protein
LLSDGRADDQPDRIYGIAFAVSSENPVRLWIDCLLRKGIKKKINKIK